MIVSIPYRYALNIIVKVLYESKERFQFLIGTL